MRNKNKFKIDGRLSFYLKWPFLLSVLLIAMNITIYMINKRAGVVMTLFVAVYILIAIELFYRSRPVILGDLITFAAQYGQVQNKLIKNLAVPYAILDAQGRLLWGNYKFLELTGKEKKYRKSITSIFPQITQDKLPDNGGESGVLIVYNQRNYRVNLKSVVIDDLIDKTDVLKVSGRDNHLVALFLFDETELNRYIKKYKEETMVPGYLYLDNYDEALESVEEVRRSLLTALVDRKINKYFHDIDGIVKKTEKDKYFFVIRQKSLDKMKEDRFSILEEVKKVNIGNKMAVTLSIGIGANTGTYAKDAEYAHIGIDLALGRGGDQAVVKEGDKTSYFGGKTQAVEKNTRVKARVKAHALKELMSSKENVVIMGHKMIDVDAFGSAIGIYRAARTLDKKAYIVIDTPTSSIRPLMKGYLDDNEYEDDMFISTHDAEEITNEDTMVVVVDVNKPSYTECEALLSLTKTIVVLDHHRQGNEVIQNSSLSYIEPYASSACEMVAEILQYFADGVRIRNIEADSIYAGIMVDTDNFMQKTGVRTFEAAAFLRRCGADVSRVRKLFREDMEDYRAKGETIMNAELYLDSFAISVCPSGYVESPTIVGAQAANELLNIVDVKASFVLTEYDNQIYVSARAIDEVNVQIIMERLGGGGHLNIAGCQFEGIDLQEAIKILKDMLKEMLDGGEI
ncbi:DHH family phosphoesterase [Blautia liquoris]|uniref:Cyclic-di-AMP phosphodiesterase n=1 Tax=Blautia liquoris TaxID=2779518 RepID=A0A7M2RIL5_9FIRM|nr:DHH family phosphoesterase [Blautia liquoris]QOV20155.1 DHH family phosphoesterase [Blautia liquoris]